MQYGLGQVRTTVKEFFMPIDTCNIKQYIQTGFRDMHPKQERNLSVSKEILASRPYPVNVTHWTENEFVQFLNLHQFPSCTFKDRLSSRNTAIIHALATGQFVPMEVMSEPESASRIEDALMYVAAAAASEKRLVSEKAEMVTFERDIGFCTSCEDYYDNLAYILESAIRSKVESQLKTIFPIESQKQIVLTVRHAVHPKFGSYGLLQSGMPKRLIIHESHSELAVLHVIDWKVIDEVLQLLFDASRLSLLLIVNRFGSDFIDWVPESMKCPRVTDSA